MSKTEGKHTALTMLRALCRFKVYQFDELSDSAKERARDWFRQTIAEDRFWSEHVESEFSDLLDACGFRPSTARRTGAHNYDLRWDTNPIRGAFSATWSAARARANAEALARILKDRPKDGLEHIAASVRTLSSAYPEATGAAIAMSGKTRTNVLMKTSAQTSMNSMKKGSAHEH